jgi:hypothetical protein
VLSPQPDIEVPEIPMDLATAVKLKKVSFALNSLQQHTAVQLL